MYHEQFSCKKKVLSYSMNDIKPMQVKQVSFHKKFLNRNNMFTINVDTGNSHDFEKFADS